MTKHPICGYEIHPVFHDLLKGLNFDLRVGAVGSPLAIIYRGRNSDDFNRLGDPSQANYIRPCSKSR